MRTLDEARDCWQNLLSFPDISKLKDSVKARDGSSPAIAGGRSACWKTFLLFDNLDVTTWSATLSSSRSAYDSLRTHFMRFLDHPNEFGASCDHLSDHADSNPNKQGRTDEELRAEILQDVERCNPDHLYFRQPSTQDMLLDILFVYCKLNAHISYRQGMHELLAPILWVVERDAINIGHTSKLLGEDAIIKAIFDAEYIENDAFTLFAKVMQSAMSFYEPAAINANESPIVTRSHRIVFELLRTIDPDLALHLQSIEVAPQVFLMRWIRLLFGREFPYDDVLVIWDILLAEDMTLELVDHISLVMLLQIRWKLMEADLNAALGLLMHYSDNDINGSPYDLVNDAIYLREHMDRDGASYLVFKYSGHPLPRGNRSSTPPPLQRHVTTVAGASPADAPEGSTRPPQSGDSTLQSYARSLYTGSEKIGIGNAVRNAMDDFHRKAQEVRQSQHILSLRPRNQRGNVGSRDQVKKMEDRDKQLAKLLGDAVIQLWKYEKSTLGEGKAKRASIDSEDGTELSLAIAKVQFVQVYLEEPDLPLPGDGADLWPVDPTDADTAKRGAAEPMKEVFVEHGSGQSECTSTPSNSVPQSAQVAADIAVSGVVAETNRSQDSLEVRKLNTDEGGFTKNLVAPSQRARPKLEQSSLSWMLGSDGHDAGSIVAEGTWWQPGSDIGHDQELTTDKKTTPTRARGKPRSVPQRNSLGQAIMQTESDLDLRSIDRGRA